eukprot:TRINITY_DN13879_c0_g1_i1.p1 TRINITY_DN13879_c0_g1~~TRINITY_DN13879_c0_g1_i1.p1  ORF type:complete len:609 (-),score=139.42 TRINITY_DN13879_c0_g1_i1:117-1943(-)
MLLLRAFVFVILGLLCSVSAQVCTAGPTQSTSSSGTIQSNTAGTNYTNGLSCAFLIQPSATAMTITLTFTRFNTEANQDIVQVFAGTSASGTLLGTFSGATIPSAVSAQTVAMYVLFTTSGSTPSSGWAASYTSSQGVCSGTQYLTGTTGVLRSNTLSSYNNNMNCGWVIIPAAGATSISITVTSFSTESNYDYLYIYQGNSASGNLLSSASGSRGTGTVVVTGGTAFVRFTSDVSNVASGFIATYSSESEPASNVYDQAIFGTPCSTAGAVVNGTYGSFADRSSGTEYANYLNCVWRLYVTNSSVTSIQFQFTSFNTESSLDTVTFYRGTAASATYTVSGSPSTSLTYTITGQSARIVFITDYSVTRSGWFLIWRTCIGSVCGPWPAPVSYFAFNLAWLGLIIPAGIFGLIICCACRRNFYKALKHLCKCNCSCDCCDRSSKPSWTPPPIVTATPAPVPMQPIVVPSPYAGPAPGGKKVQPAAAGGVQHGGQSIDPKQLYGAGYAVPPPVYNTYGAPPPPFPSYPSVAAAGPMYTNPAYGVVPPPTYGAPPPPDWDPILAAASPMPPPPAYPDAAVYGQPAYAPTAAPPAYPDAPPPPYPDAQHPTL